MRLSNLKIKNYRQFKDLELDLTYPAGHNKEGLPLDKVCFIGQSGTGKTTLLKAIFDMCIPSLTNLPLNEFKLQLDLQTHIRGNVVHDNFSYSKSIYNNGHSMRSYGDLKNDGIEPNDTSAINDFTRLFEEKIINDKVKFLYYPDLLGQRTPGKLHFSVAPVVPDVTYKDQMFFDFSKIDIIGIWQDMQKEIDKWSEEESELALLLLDYRNEPEKQSEIKVRIENWYKENPHPTESLGINFDELLNKFFLEVAKGVNPEILRKNKSISIANKMTKEIFEYSSLSSGIQSIIFKSLPLYLYRPEKGIVIMDEVDVSLYPDIQRTFIDYLTGIAPSAQYFFATHSPFILSSFEPWEVIELAFDKEGNVTQKKYYDANKGRHVDNYFIWPQYLRWDDIVMKSFGTNVEGNENIRNEFITKALRLKKQIEKLRKDQKEGSPEYNEKVEKYRMIINKIGWNYEAH